ncbi:MAG: hypothetical protein ACPG49_02465 [Chitinophagales bacterium]
MVQKTENISIVENSLSSKTISISIEVSYEQILELALQLVKEEKGKLIKVLKESLVSEGEKEVEPLVEEPTLKYNSTTAEEINTGKSKYEPVGRDYLKKLQEEAQRIGEEEPLTNEELNKQIKEHL